MIRTRLHLQLAGTPERLDLTCGISEHDVAPLLLKVPGSDEYSVAHLDPDPPFHLSTNPADPSDTVRALDKDPVVAKEILNGAVHLAGTRSKHFAQVGLAQDLALAHFLTVLARCLHIKAPRYSTVQSGPG